MTKSTPHSVLIADSTRWAMQGPAADLVLADEADLRGKQSSVGLWTLSGIPKVGISGPG